MAARRTPRSATTLACLTFPGRDARSADKGLLPLQAASHRNAAMTQSTGMHLQLAPPPLSLVVPLAQGVTPMDHAGLAHRAHSADQAAPALQESALIPNLVIHLVPL